MSNSIQTSTMPPPNWYPDNADPNLQRWWDGQQWTTHTAPAAAPAVQTTPTSFDTGRYAYSNPVTVAGANSIATRAFVYSLIGLVIDPFAMMGIGAVVLGIRGLRRAPQYAAESDRHGFAVAAIIIGSVDILAAIFWTATAIATVVARTSAGG